ncbi:MAG TPA: hypothetical protein VIM07_04045 [Chitinophagaceae bacterium]
METLGKIKDRLIKFGEFNTSTNWLEEFPNNNWCLIILADEKNKNYFEEIIGKSIDRNVAYICAVGKQYELIHDLADEEIVFREVDIENNYLPKHLIITVGEKDFENGIWFGIYSTLNSESEINEIIIIDVTKKYRKDTFELIEKFKNGYFPA